MGVVGCGGCGRCSGRVGLWCDVGVLCKCYSDKEVFGELVLLGFRIIGVAIFLGCF